MDHRASHLDMTEVFCDVDDFCQVFEPLLAQMLLPEVVGQSRPKKRLTFALKVCHKNRANSHKVFAGLAEWGKSSMGFYFGFKLHLIINDYGEFLIFQVTPANVYDRKVVPELTEGIVGKILGDKGYISEKKFRQLGVEIAKLTRTACDMKLSTVIGRIILPFRQVYASNWIGQDLRRHTIYSVQ